MIAAVPRTSSSLTAAQRLELLNESITDSGTGRRLSGDDLARRKANFLEAIKSSSPQTDQVAVKKRSIDNLSIHASYQDKISGFQESFSDTMKLFILSETVTDYSFIDRNQRKGDERWPY